MVNLPHLSPLTLIKKHWPVLVLFLSAIAIFVTNYQPGTFLLGWDTTAPELNLSANLNHFLFGVWQDYRGLGTLDGMAHTANLMHWGYVWLLNRVLPISVIRYVVQIGLHFLGGLGTFLVIKKIVLPAIGKENQLTKYHFAHNLLALFGALVYQLNFMTIQMFYLPLELFSYHFAAIPWLIYTLWQYLQKPLKSRFGWFFSTLLLTTPQAHVPSVFIPLAITLGLLLFIQLLTNPKKMIWPVLMAGVAIVITQSFWGVPYIYSAIHKAPEITASKINQFSTTDIFYRNLAWGGLTDLATFGGFNLDYLDWSTSTHTSQYLMKPWNEYRNGVLYQVIVLVTSLLALYGVAATTLSTFKNKHTELVFFILGMVLFFVLLGNDVPVIRSISWLLRTYVPFYADIFRFTFTKFSLLYVFFVSCFTTLGIWYFTGLIAFIIQKSRTQASWILPVVTLTMTAGIVFTAAPLYRGTFFYNELVVELPPEYMQVRDALNQLDPNGMIAIAPNPSFFGWTSNTWGHRGSGFIWQTLSNPVLDHAFNPWSKNNELFHTRLDFLLRTNSPSAAYLQLFKEYRVPYLLLDKTIFEPNNSLAERQLEQLEKVVAAEQLPIVAQAGKITVYATKVKPDILEAPNRLTSVSTASNFESLSDTLYTYLGDFIAQASSTKAPFANLGSEKLSEPLQLTGDYLDFSTQVSKNATFLIPNIASKSSTLFVTYEGNYDEESHQLLIKATPQLPSLLVENDSKLSPPETTVAETKVDDAKSQFFISLDKQVFVVKPKQGKFHIATIPAKTNQKVSIELFSSSPSSSRDITPDLASQTVQRCWSNPNKKSSIQKSNQPFTLTSTNATACTSYQLSFDAASNSGKLSPSTLLMAIPYSFKTESSRPRICIRQSSSGECSNPLESNINVSSQWNETVLFHPLQATGDYSLDFINTVYRDDTEYSVSFSDIQLLFYPLLTTSDYDLQENVASYDAQLASLPSTLFQDKKVTFRYDLGANQDRVLREYWPQNRGLQQVSNCDVFSRGTVGRELGSTSRTLTAKDKATVCERFKYPFILPGTEVLFSITGQNGYGSGLKGFFADTKLYVKELDFATQGENFNVMYPVSMRNDAQLGPVELTLFVQSYDEQPTTTKIDSISFTPLPLSWMSSILEVDPTTTLTQDVTITSWQKINPTLYTVDFSVKSDQGTLIFFRGYDEGWLAVDTSSWRLSGTHLVANGWANSWTFEKGDHKIFLVYWPQLLMFSGLAGIGLLSMGLLLALIFHKK